MATLNPVGATKSPILSDLENARILGIQAIEISDKEALMTIRDKINALDIPAKLKDLDTILKDLNATQDLSPLMQSFEKLSQSIEEKISLVEKAPSDDPAQPKKTIAIDKRTEGKCRYRLDDVNSLWTYVKQYYCNTNAIDHITEMERNWRLAWELDPSILGRRQLIGYAQIFVTKISQDPRDIQTLTEKMQKTLIQHGKRTRFLELEDLKKVLEKLPEKDKKRKLYEKKAELIQIFYDNKKISLESFRKINSCYTRELEATRPIIETAYTQTPLRRLEVTHSRLKFFFNNIEDPFTTLQMILTELKTASEPFPELADQLKKYQKEADQSLLNYSIARFDDPNRLDKKQFKTLNREHIQELNDLIQNFILHQMTL